MNPIDTLFIKTLALGFVTSLVVSNAWSQPYSVDCPHDTALQWTACHGTLVKDGNTYSGEFLNNLFHGKGVYHFSNGDYYNGTFKKGMPDGWGVYVFMLNDKNKGDIYVGDFELGQAHGRGTTFFRSGGMFTGQYVSGLPDGMGIYLDRDGVLLHEGTWREGKFIASARVSFLSDANVFNQSQLALFIKSAEVENLQQANKEKDAQVAQQQQEIVQLRQWVDELERKQAQQLETMSAFYQEKTASLEEAVEMKNKLVKQLQTELDQLKQSLFMQSHQATSVPNSEASISPKLSTDSSGNQALTNEVDKNTIADNPKAKPSTSDAPVKVKKKSETKAPVNPPAKPVDPMKDTFLYLQ